MAGGVSMIFFTASGLSLSDAARLLAARKFVVTQKVVAQEEDRLLVRLGSGPVLTIGLAEGVHISEEAVTIAKGGAHAADMSLCNARFEIAFDDLRAVLDDINTLIEAQLALQNATQGFLFNSWNAKLTGPGE
jgi:hypothetical protein